MAPEWTPSSDKHGISRADQLWALTHPSFQHVFPVEADGSSVWLFVGHPHEQTDREIEILVRVFDTGRPAVVFHAMPLSSKYRDFREDQRNV